MTEEEEEQTKEPQKLSKIQRRKRNRRLCKLNEANFAEEEETPAPEHLTELSIAKKVAKKSSCSLAAWPHTVCSSAS